MAKHSSVKRTGLVQEFWLFLRKEKKWWLAPLIFLLIMIGILLVFAESSVIAPFLYPLF